MKKIILTKNQVALVDDEDFDTINEFKWGALWSKNSQTFYATRNKKFKGKQYTLYMHRFIMQLQEGDKRQIDHKNHNGLDNRKENLFIVTSRQNHYNIKNQSKYGFCIYKMKRKKNPYKVQVKINGKIKHIGVFPSQEKAEIAREEWIFNNVSSI